MRKWILGLAAVLTASVCVAGGTPKRAMGQEEIAARVAIEDTWSRYLLALDTFDREKLAALFTEDTYFEVDGIPYKGRDGVRNFVDKFRFLAERSPPDLHGRKWTAMRHIGSNLVINFDSRDTATSESYWTEIIANGDGKDKHGRNRAPSVFNMGRYEDVFKKQSDGRWLISRRVVFDDMFVPRPPGLEEKAD